MWHILIIVILLFWYPLVALADTSVVINEFTVDPEQKIELWNTSLLPIDISNWYLDDSGGTTYFTVPPGTLLYPGACTIFNENLNLNKSSSDQIRLFDSTAPPTTSSAHLVDSFVYAKSPGSGVSWFRLPDGGSLWATGSANIGFSNTLGSACYVSPTPTMTITPLPTSTPHITPSPTPEEDVSNCIFLSEVMSYPAAGQPEWVELHNKCAQTVVLTDWHIDDTAGAGSSPFVFSTSIPGSTFRTIYLSSSMLNNSGDSVTLYDRHMNLVDSHILLVPKQDRSFSRQSFTPDSVWCLTAPTPDTSNNNCDTDEINPSAAVMQPVAHTDSTPTPPAITPEVTLNLRLALIPTSVPNILGASTEKSGTATAILLLRQALLAYITLAVSSATALGLALAKVMRRITA